MTENFIDPHLDFQSVILRIFSGLCLFVVHCDPGLQAAAVQKYLFQNPYKLLLLAPVQHIVLHGKQDLLLPGIGNVCHTEGIVLNVAVLPQFCQNALSISLHQVLGRILG